MNWNSVLRIENCDGCGKVRNREMLSGRFFTWRIGYL